VPRELSFKLICAALIIPIKYGFHNNKDNNLNHKAHIQKHPQINDGKIFKIDSIITHYSSPHPQKKKKKKKTKYDVAKSMNQTINNIYVCVPKTLKLSLSLIIYYLKIGTISIYVHKKTNYKSDD
jgi:hypothetical protein